MNQQSERLYILNPNLSMSFLNEALNEHFGKLEALLNVAFCDGFLDCNRLVIDHYLW